MCSPTPWRRRLPSTAVAALPVERIGPLIVAGPGGRTLRVRRVSPRFEWRLTGALTQGRSLLRDRRLKTARSNQAGQLGGRGGLDIWPAERARRSGGQRGARAHLRLRALQRLERAGHPEVRVRAPRALWRQELWHDRELLGRLARRLGSVLLRDVRGGGTRAGVSGGGGAASLGPASSLFVPRRADRRDSEPLALSTSPTAETRPSVNSPEYDGFFLNAAAAFAPICLTGRSFVGPSTSSSQP